MHISELSGKFKFFVGKTLYGPSQLSDQGNSGHNQPPYDLEDKRNLNLFKRLRTIAHMFNSELVIEGLPYQDHAVCKVHMRTRPDKNGRPMITGFEARVDC